uniref:Uncharacterized protein n=1 Tax=Solanum lycopersicum TaxID=4081 RepID=A0A3Q7FZ12_SOLLC
MMTATMTTTVSVGSSSFFTNYPLMSALIAFALAQSIKLFTSWYKERRWDLKQLVGSGGMPSSHSSTVTALAVAVGLQEGFGGALFACALVLACVVMYDATGVRLHAGRQAEVLNQILYELPSEHPLADSRPLRELLGHTPPQENVNHHAAQHDPTDMPTETIPQQVQNSNTAAQKSTDDCLNIDASTASKSKPPTLDDYPDFTMTQIIALDPILNATTTPNMRTRNKNVG